MNWKNPKKPIEILLVRTFTNSRVAYKQWLSLSLFSYTKGVSTEVMIKIILLVFLASAYAETGFEVNSIDSRSDYIVFDSPAFDKAISSVSNLSAFLKVIKYLPRKSQIADGIESVFKHLNKNEGLTNSKALVLAFEIKEAMKKETLQVLNATYTAMKMAFPLSIREIIWNRKVHLKNEHFGEYLFAAENNLARDKERRSIFTRVNKSFTGDDSSTWYFETNDGQTFFMRNKKFHEYLYTAADDLDYDSQRKNVFTWIPGGRDYPEANWWIDVANENQIVLRSAHRNGQHLFAGKTVRDNSRRYVFTWIPQDSSHISPTSLGIWNVSSA